MVVDDRQITLNAAGEAFDLSGAEDFDYAAFFGAFRSAQMLQLHRDEVSWLRKAVDGDRPAQVTLNLSCGVQSTPHVMLTQVQLFDLLGVDYAAMAGPAYCCGRIYQRYGQPETGQRMAENAIERFESWRAPVNVQSCGSCLIEFDYHVRRIEEETGRQQFDVVHLTEFLRDRLRELGDRIPWQREMPLRVLLHHEGEEVHPTKEVARQAVIETLEMIPGVEFVGMVENPSHGQPCASTYPGGPSVLNDLAPEQYEEVVGELEMQLREAEADVIVTGHHKCHFDWCKFGSERAPIAYYGSVLAEALGVSVPDRFQDLWRLGDPDEILEASRPYWTSWGVDEDGARQLVQQHFVPSYQPAVQRCPCDGQCFLSPDGAPEPISVDPL